MIGELLKAGYGRGEIEPRIMPLVKAVQAAGFVTFSSCEGHVDDADEDSFPRFTSVAFYADEAEARHVHEAFLRYRERLACSWCLRAGFVAHRETDQFVLGWTLENCGFLGDAEQAEFVRRTVVAGWDTDIPLLIEMFGEIERTS